jgi:uncharacterized protein (TIGR00251 family)
MTNRKFHFHNGTTGAALAVRITPRSSRNEVSDVLEDGTVKIRLTAPPVEGQANEALVRFLGEILDLAPSRIEIVAGQTGRDKLVTITGIDSSTLQERIMSKVAKPAKDS